MRTITKILLKILPGSIGKFPIKAYDICRKDLFGKMVQIVLRKVRCDMYLIGIIAVVILSVVFMLCGFSGAGIGGLIYIVDAPSILIVFIITVAVLLLAGYGKDVLKAFVFTGKKKDNVNVAELKRCMEAISLTIKTVLLSGILATILGMMMILNKGVDQANLGASFSVSLITILYAIMISLILMPVKSRLYGMMVDVLHE